MEPKTSKVTGRKCRVVFVQGFTSPILYQRNAPSTHITEQVILILIDFLLLKKNCVNCGRILMSNTELCSQRSKVPCR